MWLKKPWRLQLHQLYCQLLLLTCLGGREQGVRQADGQAVDCTNILKSSETNLSVLQPCFTSSAGAPVVLNGSRRFEASPGEATPTLDFFFKSSTLLLLPPGAVTEIISANITGVRLAKPAIVLVQLFLAVSVQPTASLLLSDVILETDCSTLARYQQWITETNPVNFSLVDRNGDVFVDAWTWKQAGISLCNCSITCRRPPAAVVSTSPSIGSEATVVTVASDVDLYNALSLAALYGSGLLMVVVERDLTMTSPLWAVQGVVLPRNASIVGRVSNSSNTTAGDSHGMDASTFRKPVLDLQDLVSGVYIEEGVVLSVVNVTFINTAMVFGSAPVAYTGLGFVSSFLWFFNFHRIVFSDTKPLNQLVVMDCDIISYPHDVVHMWVWATFLTSNVEPVKSQAAPYKAGVYNLVLSKDHSPAVEFSMLEAYGMLYENTGIVPNVNSTINVTLTSRSSGVPLYALNIPIAATAVPVWTHSDFQNVLALAQRSPCLPSNTTTYIHLFTNMSLDQSKWPYAGYNISCNITISGTLSKEGGTWLNFNLLPRFITLTGGAVLTFRYLTLFNMPSQLRTYSLGNLTQMTLPMWPVARPPGTSLLLLDSTIVLPGEEYRMLADVVAGKYHWSALDSSMKVSDIRSQNMSVIFLSGFSMILSNTLITDSSGNIPFTAMLGPFIYGTNVMPPAPDSASSGNGSTTAAAVGRSSSKMTSASVVAVGVAIPLGLMVAASVAAMAILLHRRRRRGVTAESSPEDPNMPEVPSMGPGPEGGSKGMGASEICAGASSNNSPHSEDASAMTDAQAGERGASLVKASGSESDAAPTAPPLHVELHQLILDFAREIEDKHLTIHDALGSGGFATVYRGTWRGIDVAVKVIEFQDRAAGNERLQARAMTEAAIAANIQHANIVTTYSYDIRPVTPNDAGQDTPSSTLLGIGPAPEGGPPAGAGSTQPRRRSGSSDHSSGSQAPRLWNLYLIQEFCEVGSLRVAIENRMFHQPDGQPNMPMILRLLLDVVRGLQHLHKKNIVHGDLTPGNILLKASMSRPGQYVAKLADFGLSVKMSPSQTSVDNNRTGTPFYASPEVRQHGNLTKASDLYALGVVLWEMWHGRPCYQRVRGIKHYIHASGYPSYPCQCPASYTDITDRCLRRTLEERPHLDEVHDVLRHLLGSAVSGLSSGSEGGTSGALSYEWPFVLNLGNPGVSPTGLAPAMQLQGAGAPALLGGCGAGASDASTAAGEDGGGTAGGSNSWFPAALVAGLQAGMPSVVPLGRAGSGKPAAVAGAAGYTLGQAGGDAGCAAGAIQAAAGGGTSWSRAGPPVHGLGGNAQEATAPLAMVHRTSQPPQQQQRQRLPPTYLRLLHGVQEDSPCPPPWVAGASDLGMGAPAPRPVPAALPQAGDTDGDGLDAGNQLLAQPPAAGVECPATEQPTLEARGGQLKVQTPAGEGAGGALPVAGGCFSSSVKLGTADEHFVTAPESTG